MSGFMKTVLTKLSSFCVLLSKVDGIKIQKNVNLAFSSTLLSSFSCSSLFFSIAWSNFEAFRSRVYSVGHLVQRLRTNFFIDTIFINPVIHALPRMKCDIFSKNVISLSIGQGEYF